MHAILDLPNSGSRVDPSHFKIRGWAWLDEAQPQVAAVELWTGNTLLGSTEELAVRPDVTSTLSLPPGSKTGFDFFAGSPDLKAGEPFDLHLQFRLYNGSKMGPFCWTHVQAGEAGAIADGSTIDAASTGGPLDELESARAKIGQLEDELAATRSEHARRNDPVPPDNLQIRQTGVSLGPLFFAEGRKITDQVSDAFREAGAPLDQAKTILDFGCGCGRVVRGLEDLANKAEIWGCDIDAEAINWNRGNLGRVAQFSRCNHLPPLRFPDAYFDAIFSISVFTHLPEEMQFAWLTELRRVLRPGGVFIASIHGAHYWRTSHPLVVAEVESRGFDYRAANLTEGLPDFYMAAFHSERYIRERWSRFFEILAVKERYICASHDAVTMRRRDD